MDRLSKISIFSCRKAIPIRFSPQNSPPPASLAAKDVSDHLGAPPAKKMKPSYIVPAKKQTFKIMYTATDEAGQAAGIPLTSVLVLRNLARNLPKTEAEDSALKSGNVSFVERLFKPVEPKLFDIMAHNKPLVRTLLPFR